MTGTLLQQAVEALTRAHAFVLNGVSLAEPANETLLVIEAAIASLESALQQQPEPVAVGDEEIVAWVDSFIRKQAYNYPVAVQIATEAAKWVRSRAAPPALQQQQEPREVAADGSFWLIERGPNQGWPQTSWWNASPDGRVCGWKASVHEATQYATKEHAERVARSDRGLRLVDVAITSHGFMSTEAASPSPQDFTLPMLEEGKGADGVKAAPDSPAFVDWEGRPYDERGEPLFTEPADGVGGNCHQTFPPRATDGGAA